MWYLLLEHKRADGSLKMSSGQLLKDHVPLFREDLYQSIDDIAMRNKEVGILLDARASTVQEQGGEVL